MTLAQQTPTSSNPLSFEPDPRLMNRMARRAQHWSRREAQLIALGERPAPSGDARLVTRRARLPRRRAQISPRAVSSVVRVIATEMMFLIGDEQSARNRRFALSHIQQIAMYVCHVVLQMTMTDVGRGFGRDRTTVGHACARVEDRRDEVGYDRLVSAIERVTSGVFAPIGAKA